VCVHLRREQVGPLMRPMLCGTAYRINDAKGLKRQAYSGCLSMQGNEGMLRAPRWDKVLT
jgi:hypothetical protein